MAEHNPTVAGADWAQATDWVAERWSGNWVVAVATDRGNEVHGEVIAAGPNPDEVRSEAARRLQLPADAIVVCAVAAATTRTWLGW